MLNQSATAPLAEQCRPLTLDEVVGQDHLLAKGKPLRQALASGHCHSMILWGPPGTGKTTLARLFAGQLDAEFVSLSAVTSGVKDIRLMIEKARANLQNQKRTIVFVDEVHRFNKAQQDAFLPHIEDGTIVFIGATTENPSFEVNNALLSRTRVYRLKSLSDEAITKILAQAVSRLALEGDNTLTLAPDATQMLVQLADGDARVALNNLSVCAEFILASDGPYQLTAETIAPLLADATRRFDKGGDHFYDLISALHKSVRGSSPDASLYWFARMLDGGCDPLYIARRVVRMASEDIGNADPRALTLALNAWETQERLGSPEGELALAQAIVYLACAPKSNAIYMAFKAAQAAVKQHGSLDVPIHLRNAPTKLMKQMGYGKAYRYAHDEPYAYAAGEVYLPDGLKMTFYTPTTRGLEIPQAVR